MSIHRNRTEGMRSVFTHPSKFIERINTQVAAREAVLEGNKLRLLIHNKRILEDISQVRELKNAFRL